MSDPDHDPGVDDHPVRRALDLARTQAGAISTSQLDDAGFGRGSLLRATQRGWLRRAVRGVYTAGGAPDTVEQRQWIGLLALGPQALVSHEAAARIHQLDRHLSDRVEFLLPRPRRGVELPFPVHTSTRFRSTDRVLIQGMPVTSATRTILDLARSRVSRRRISAAIDSAIRLQLSSHSVIAERLETLRGRGRWGARLIDDLLPDTGGESPIERRFLQLMREAGLPRPKPQVVHRNGAGRAFARVDFLFVEHGLVVEVSGRWGHASDEERARDAQRRNELQDIGLSVYEFTRADLYERSAYVVTTVANRLGQTCASI